MKKFLLLLVTSFAVASASFAKPYTINPTVRYQTHEGWGTSLCWWAAMCGRHNEAQIDSLIDWLVSPEGLNYNVFRYNIGGGDDPMWTHCAPHHMCYPKSGKGYRAEMEGFQDERGGDFHWERDAAQRKVMLMIKQKRPDAIFEAFSNSAPWWMTVSGCVGGNKKGEVDNLDPEYYEDFARYLVAVCKHYKEAYGIEFYTLDPFNEPLTNYWYSSGSQEGCHFDTESQVKFLRVLYPMLQASGLRTVISASDESWVSHSLEEFAFYDKEDALKMVGQWNTHTYKGTAEEKRELSRLAKEKGLRLWQSETGDGGRGIEGNLKMAQRLIEDIKCLQPAAWVDWQYVEEGGNQWSLVKCDHVWGKYTRHANYYVRQHFSRYIPVGYTFVETDDPDGLCAVSTDGKELVYVTLNATKSSRSLQVQLPSGFAVEKSVMTQSEAFAQPFASYAVKNKQLQFTLPALSIVTFVCRR